VAAAHKYGRIAQTGSQHRSCPATHKAREYVQGGKLGKLQWAYAVVFNRHPSIGKAAGPLAIPGDVDHDLYAGPATSELPVRKQLHYDWHWQWPMGTGEAANWGAHVIDDMLNMTGVTRAPRAARSIGGRLGYDDDGETPNTMLVAYDVGDFPLVAQLRALPMKAGVEAMDHYRGVRLGTVVQCENGYYAGGRGGGWIYDNKGKRVEQVEGDGGSGHVQNFLDAVRSRKPEQLNAPMQAGHMSALYCQLGNMSYRLGEKVPADVGRKGIATSSLASTPGSPPNRSCHRPKLSSSVPGAPSRSSSGENARPSSGRVPRSGMTSAVSVAVSSRSGSPSPTRLSLPRLNPPIASKDVLLRCQSR
jgi:hypothetical protein